MEAMCALGFTVCPQHSTRSNSCPGLLDEETEALKGPVQEDGSQLGGWACPPLGIMQGAVARSSLRRLSVPTAQPSRPSLILSASRRQIRVLRPQGRPRTQGDAKAHGRPENPLLCTSLLVPEWDLSHLPGATRNNSGRVGLVLGSSERWAHIPFLARPPTSLAAFLL